MSGLRLMLVRHGQTESNVAHLLDSRPPGPPLTDLGRTQADGLAERLAGQKVDAVYASIAVRAQETAEPLAKSQNLSVEVLDGVHEVQVGDLEGKGDAESLTQFGAVFLKWVSGELDEPMPGGETGGQVRDRYLAAVRAIQDRHDDGLVVVVSHGAAIRLMADLLADNVGPQLAHGGLMPNTGHVLLEARESGWHCLEWTGVEI